MARIIKWGLAGLAVLVVAAAVTAFMAYSAISGTDRGPLKMWIEGQIRGIVQAYLNPQIEFQALVYEYPRTVRLAGLRLTSPDPDDPGKTVDIVTVAKLTMELAEIPKEGQPIRIQQLILDHPSLQLVVPAGREGKLVGFSDFIKQSAAATPQSAQPREVRLSEVFQITLLQLIEGEVAYQTRAGEVRTLRLDGISSRMDIRKDQTGWYGITAGMERKGILKLGAAGRLNLDDSTLNVQSLALDVKLGREQDRYFPPQLQAFLRDHKITGAMSLEMSGTVPLADPLAARVSAAASVSDAHFVAGAYRGQADRIDLAMDMADARLDLTRLSARTLGGQVDISGTVELKDDNQASLKLDASGVHIEDTLRAVETGGEPRYRGVFSAGVSLNCHLARLSTDAAGSGWAQLRDGKMSNVPVFGQVLNKLASALTLNVVGGHDSGDFNFTLAGNRVHFSKIDFRSAAYAVRGGGDLYFKGDLDLTVTAGPLEKIESAFGRLGSLVGKATDKLIRYHVGGTVDNPAITVQPLSGIGEVLKLPRNILGK
ncbi:MAG: AsmA-like C-terminal region-containing protein [Phycisphaerae bacterium]